MNHFKVKWGDSLNAERLAIFAEMPTIFSCPNSIWSIYTLKFMHDCLLKRQVKVKS